MSARFVPLHVHSHYSLLKALPKIPELVAAAKEAGCEALALTDIDNLYGAIEFYKECKAQGIKPIIGLDATLEGGARTLLYAQNETGYKNLIRLVTESHLTDALGVPLTHEQLERCAEGVLRLDPKDPTVALAEVYYLEPADQRAWETLRAIENRGPTEDGNLQDEDDEHFFLNTGHMEARFTQEQLQKTLDVAAQCTLEMTLGKFVFPKFPLPPDKTADEVLRELCQIGLEARGGYPRPDGFGGRPDERGGLKI